MAAGDDLSALLSKLSLEQYKSTFEDEEITEVSLLHSMGEEMLRESMVELGMKDAHVDVLAKALFSEEGDGEDELALEDNAGGDDDDGLALEDNDDDGLALEANEAPAPAPPASVAAAEPVTTAAPTVSAASKKAAERVKNQGNDALKNGQFADAAVLYGQAIGLDPTNAAYYSNRSSAYASLSQFEKALDDAKNAIRLKSDWAKAHLRHASALTGLRRHQEALDAYNAALQCEPSNAQIKALVAAASETALVEKELAADGFDWMAELNDRVAPTPFYERGLQLQDDAPMTIDYREALQEGLEAIGREEGRLVLRTPRGAAMVVNGIEGTNFEKIVCVGARTATTTAQQLKGATGPVAVKLWHMLSDWRDEGDDEDAIRERMIRRADAEHTRIRALSGCKHWLQLIADVAAEKEALIGSVPYPAIYLEHFPGQDLTELLTILQPPGARQAAKRANAAAANGADDDSDCSDDDHFDDDDEEEVDEEAVAEAWERAKAEYTPDKLGEELALIKEVALGTMRALKEAHGAGFRFEPDGSEGPFLGDVLFHKGRVKLVDTEPLGEYEEGDDQRFTAEPLVYSPVGEYLRAWWESTRLKIGMEMNTQHPDKRYAEVLSGYGALNWMLFKWEPERLQGDEIIRLLTHGAEQAAPHHDPTLEAHWEDFMNRAFVMLGPRRFDELKEISNLIQANEITGPDVVARSRYLMGREFEGLHSEYLKILKKAGVKLK